MIDLNKEREAFEALPQIISILVNVEFYFSTLSMNYKSNKPDHLHCVYFINGAWYAWLEKAKAQAVQAWILASTKLPDEGEEVLFLDSHNVIHEGTLNTDYVDGPYGENSEDNGDYQTLWTSNSNGEEYLLEEVKYWMHRPSTPITGGSGAEQ